MAARSVSAARNSPGQRRRPLGPQAHLGRRLFAGDVEREAGRRGPARSDLEEQCRLADARLARQQDDGTLHESATEGPVELVDTRGQAGIASSPTAPMGQGHASPAPEQVR